MRQLTSIILTSAFSLSTTLIFAQTNPAITSWLQNTTEVGSYYMDGNSTTISNDILVNVQSVDYSADWVYVTTNGIPSYPTGPFLDGNPSQAEAQSAIFKIPLQSTENKGTLTETTPGNIGVFINGVALFDWRDGVAWNPQNNSLCGGPGNPPCPGGMGAQMDWNRDAIPAEKAGFDCSKGHPAMGNYHHHQNPSAFKLDLDVVSTVCNLYDADGLYAIDSTKHAPLIGFAYDGFPIYGAYGYKNTDGTGGISRMKSGYELVSGTTRTNGPDVSTTYFSGYFKEDYQYVANSASDYLDEHNGRFCVTPEYPDGIYAYFATVDENWNSAFPYAVGPTFYGNVVTTTVSSITETVTNYVDPALGIAGDYSLEMNVNIFPNPASDLIAIQIGGVVRNHATIQLFDINGRLIEKSVIRSGSTISYLDTRTIKSGNYVLAVEVGGSRITQNVVVSH
jgi:hypothetical protein